MKGIEVNLEQDTSEWHEFRSLGIGGSDAPTLMMMNKYKTIYALLEEKMTGISQFVPNFASERGKTMEPYARTIYEENYDLIMIPKLFIHHKKSYLRCSLDGINPTGSFIIEIKTPMNKADLTNAKNGGSAPVKYLAQIMLQLMCTGAMFCDFITYDGASTIYVVRIWPSNEWIREILIRSMWFWRKAKQGLDIESHEIDKLNNRNQILLEAEIKTDNFRVLTSRVDSIF